MVSEETNHLQGQDIKFRTLVCNSPHEKLRAVGGIEEMLTLWEKSTTGNRQVTSRKTYLDRNTINCSNRRGEQQSSAHGDLSEALHGDVDIERTRKQRVVLKMTRLRKKRSYRAA